MSRVLQDHAGWYYVLRLAGAPDFDPSLFDEITGAFDVDLKPISMHELAPAHSEAGSEAAPPEIRGQQK